MSCLGYGYFSCLGYVILFLQVLELDVSLWVLAAIYGQLLKRQLFNHHLDFEERSIFCLW